MAFTCPAHPAATTQPDVPPVPLTPGTAPGTVAGGSAPSVGQACEMATARMRSDHELSHFARNGCQFEMLQAPRPHLDNEVSSAERLLFPTQTRTGHGFERGGRHVVHNNGKVRK